MSNDDSSEPSAECPSLATLMQSPRLARAMQLPTPGEVLGEPAPAPGVPHGELALWQIAATMTAGYWTACAADRDSCPSFGFKDFMDTWRAFYQALKNESEAKHG